MKLRLLLLSLVFAGCASSPNTDIETAYGHREDVLTTFKGISIFRKRTGNSVFLHTYKEGLKNEYVFTVNQGEYILLRDSLSFSPDFILGVNKSEQDSIAYRKQLTDKLEFYLRKMDVLKISDISGEFSKQGIDLKIYMNPQGVLVYVSDSKKVVNPEWSKYINSMQKLDENWYYTVNE